MILFLTHMHEVSCSQIHKKVIFKMTEKVNTSTFLVGDFNKSVSGTIILNKLIIIKFIDFNNMNVYI